MSKIVNVKAREVLDSRGNPTLEAEVTSRKMLFLQKNFAICGIMQKVENSDTLFSH